MTKLVDRADVWRAVCPGDQIIGADGALYVVDVVRDRPNGIVVMMSGVDDRMHRALVSPDHPVTIYVRGDAGMFADRLDAVAIDTIREAPLEQP